MRTFTITILVAFAAITVRAQSSFTNVFALAAFKASTLREGVIASVSGYQNPGDGGDGRWIYMPTSTATTNWTSIIPANPSGRWKRLEADWVKPEWAGARVDGLTDDTQALQRSIDDTPINATLVLPYGSMLVSSNLIFTKPITVKGHPLGSTIVYSSTFPTNQDVLVFRPSARFQNLTLRDFAVLPESGTPSRNALVFDTKTANTAWSEVLCENLFLRAKNGAGVYIDNSTYTHDGFFTSTFRNCIINGGVQAWGLGDSVQFENCVVTTASGSTSNAYHGFTIRQIINSDFSGGNAKLLSIRDCNITAHGGIMLIHAYMPRIVGNNMELYEGPQTLWTNRALIALRGESGVPIYGATIEANYLGPASHQVDRAIQLVYAQDTFIRDNDIPQVYGQVVAGVTNAYQGIRIHSGTTKTYVYSQRWKFPTWYGAANRMLVDEGLDTIRFRPQGIVYPPWSSPINWDNNQADLVYIRATSGAAVTIDPPSFNYLQHPMAPGQRLTLIITNASGGDLGTITWNSQYKVNQFRPPPAGQQTVVNFYLGADLSSWIEGEVSEPWDRGMLIGTNAPFVRITNWKLSTDIAIGSSDGTNGVLTLVAGAVDTNELSSATHAWISSKAPTDSPTFTGTATFATSRVDTLVATNIIGTIPATNIDAAIARLASPSFTGTPTVNGTNWMALLGGSGASLSATNQWTAPQYFGTATANTPAAGDNSTNAATTAWAQTEFKPYNASRRKEILNIGMLGNSIPLAVSPLANLAINGGDAFNVFEDASFGSRHGYISIKSSVGAGAGSGQYIGLYNNALALTNVTICTWDLMLVNPADVIVLAGYGDAIGTSESADSVHFAFTNNLLYGVILNNSSRTLSASSYAAPTNVWLTCETITSNSTAYLTLYTNGTSAWSTTMAGVPLSPFLTAPALRAWSSGPTSTNNKVLCYLDQFYFETEAKLR